MGVLQADKTPKVFQPREGHEKSSANVIAYPHEQSTEEIEARRVGKGLSVKYDRLNTHMVCLLLSQTPLG